MNIINHTIDNELIGSRLLGTKVHRQLRNNRNKSDDLSLFTTRSIYDSNHFTARLPYLLQEHEFDLKASNVNKIFTSQWLDERKCIMGTKCNKLIVMDTITGKYSVQAPPKSHPNSKNVQNHCGIHAISINPSRTLLATGAENVNDVAIYSLPSLEPVAVGFNAHSYWIFDMCWLNDEYVVSGSGDNRLALWKAANNRNHVYKSPSKIKSQFIHKTPSKSSHNSPHITSSSPANNQNNANYSLNFLGEPILNRQNLKRPLSFSSMPTTTTTTSSGGGFLSSGSRLSSSFFAPFSSQPTSSSGSGGISTSGRQRFNFINYFTRASTNRNNMLNQFTTNATQNDETSSSSSSDEDDNMHNNNINDSTNNDDDSDHTSNSDNSDSDSDSELELDSQGEAFFSFNTNNANISGSSIYYNNSNAEDSRPSFFEDYENDEYEEEEGSEWFSTNSNNNNGDNSEEEDESDHNNSSFKRRRLNSMGKFKRASKGSDLKYIVPTKVIKCKQSKRIRALAFNPKRNEIAAISMNSAFHYFDIRRFEQKYTKKLSPLKENVCLTLNDDYSIYAIGSASHVQLLDANNAKPLTEPIFVKKDIGIRSLHFRNSILSVGTGTGTVLFYDLRANKFLCNSPDFMDTAGVNTDPYKLHTTGGWILKNQTYYENLPYGLNNDNSHAIYSHSYDPSGTKLLTVGGPLTVNLYGHYVGLWR